MAKYWWGDPDPKLIRNGVVRCPKCMKRPANISSMFGVELCDTCKKKSYEYKGFKGMDKNKFTDYIATPFWKHMGLKPKPEELAREKEMNRRGLTYGDLYRMRHMNGKYSNEGLVKAIQDGTYKKPSTNYSKKEG